MDLTLLVYFPFKSERETKRCTWSNCKQPAVSEQRNTSGYVWARLCERHTQEYERH